MKLISIIRSRVFPAVLAGILTFGFSQSTPVDFRHPVYTFIRQQIALSHVRQPSNGIQPYTHSEIRHTLGLLSKNDALSDFDKETLKIYSQEFEVDTMPKGLSGVWQSGHRRKLSKQLLSINGAAPHFAAYKDNQLTTWIDWEETIRWQRENDVSRGYYSDRLSIHGEFNNHLSFYSDYTLYRLENAPGFSGMPNEYKQGHKMSFDEVDLTIWDISQASIVYENPVLNIEFSKKPVYWGLSPKNSPIFSNQVLPFTFIGFSKKYKRVEMTSFHGALMPFSPTRRDSVIPEKRIAGHRFDFSPGDNITLAFSEMVIYARRTLEPGYLLPVNLFWSEEHNLGDRDNILMAFEAKWGIRPGIEIYGTFLWDELSWLDLFSQWWGNKFVFQSGFYWVPSLSGHLPDLRVEFTAARPWVYTHNDSLITFTSADIGLGFPHGPNSQLLYVESNWWLSPQSLWTLSYRHLAKGSNLGSNPTDNYNNRDQSLDDNTPFLLGEITTSNQIELQGNYRISYMLEGFINLSYLDEPNQIYGQIGFVFNW